MGRSCFSASFPGSSLVSRRKRLEVVPPEQGFFQVTVNYGFSKFRISGCHCGDVNHSSEGGISTLPHSTLPAETLIPSVKASRNDALAGEVVPFMTP